MDHKKVNIKQIESIRLHTKKDKMIINRFHVSLIRFVIGESLLVEVFVISRILLYVANRSSVLASLITLRLIMIRQILPRRIVEKKY